MENLTADRTRPKFSIAYKSVTHEFEGNRWAGSRTETVGRRYFASQAGVDAYMRLHGYDEDPGDPEFYLTTEVWGPGRVYNHQTHQWEDGMTWVAPHTLHPKSAYDESDDEIPF